MNESSVAPSLEIPEINIDDYQRFLLFLAGDTEEKEIFTFMFMDPESNKAIKGLGTKHETIDGALHLLNLNKGATLHVCLNRTSLKAKRDKSCIVGCRCLVVDIDKETETEEILEIVRKFRPHLIVESSPKKYHIYWKLDSGIKLEVWSQWQLGLAHILGGDYNLAQVTHTLRVPGVPRLKNGEWIVPRLIGWKEDGEYEELQEIPSEWGIDIYEAYSEALRFKKNQAKLEGKLTESVSAGIAGKPITIDTVRELLGEGQEIARNSVIFGCLVSFCKQQDKESKKLTGDRAQIELSDLEAFALKVNETFQSLTTKGKLDEFEVVSIAQKMFRNRESYLESCTQEESSLLENVDDSNVSLPITSEVTLKEGKVNGSYVNGINGGGTSSHNYNYELDVFREGPMSDEAIVEMVFQRFRENMFRAGKVVFGFDSNLMYRIWRAQKGTFEIIHGYVKECIWDVIRGPKIVGSCMEAVGKSGKRELNEKKLRALKERLLSGRTANQVVHAIINDDRLIRKEITMFDVAPYLFLCANGVVNLLVGDSVRVAEPSDYMLRQSPVRFDKEAKCPYFEQFISEIFADNKSPVDMVRFIQEVFGYSITASTEEQTIYVHSGDGANGKSCLLRVLDTLLGDYLARMDAGAMTKTKTSAEKEIARMGAKIEGKRVMLIDDLDTKTQWDDSLVKALTDTKIVARYLYEEERDIQNKAKIHIGCNQTPEVREAGHAMFRRICIIEYKRTFKTNPAKMKEIEGKIKEELPGILNWAIEGLKRTQLNLDKKIILPEEVKERMNEYKEVNAGIEERLEEIFAEPENETEVYTGKEVLEYVESVARQMSVRCNFTPEKLGREITKLKVKKQKIKIEKTKTGRKYSVKLVFKESLSPLFSHENL